MPIRCNRGFYCRSYCLLNMFRAPLCPSSGAQEYYTLVSACGIWRCGVQSCWSVMELRVMCRVCRMLLAQEYYTVVAACGIWCCGFQCCWSVMELRVMCPVCRMLLAQEYYTVVAACGIWCCGVQSCWSGVELKVVCPVCRMLLKQHNPQLHTRPTTLKTTAPDTTGSNHFTILLSS